MKTYTSGPQHAEACDGDPVITSSRSGEWSAHCHHRVDGVQCAWEVSGCESRAEAGAAFFGCDPRQHDGDHFFAGDEDESP